MTGIVIVDKPAGWTSFDVTAKLRGIYHERRVGHGGTLDPMATGVLPVFLGRATRAIPFYEEDGDKEYVAGLRLGLETDTEDLTGRVLAERPVDVTPAQVRAALTALTGEQLQVPPMYSARKVDGQRLYALARQGRTVERAPRPITVREIELLDGGGADYRFRVRCTRGTYVRTLCADLGRALGCGGCMSSLRRMQAGDFRLEYAYTLSQVQEAADRGEAERLLRHVDSLFDAYPALTVAEKGEQRLRCGGTAAVTAADGNYRVYGSKGDFLALGSVSNGECRSIKSFFEV